MCLSPITIKNPLRNKEHLSTDPMRFKSDISSAYIKVPCGRCAQCIALKQNYFIQRCDMQSYFSHMYFLTFTYDNEHLPIHYYLGKRYAHPDIRHIQNMFKRVRKHRLFDGRCFRYFVCSEYGSRRMRPHFHMLLFVQKRSGDTPDFMRWFDTQIHNAFLQEWRVNVAKDENGNPNTRCPKYEPLCQYKVASDGSRSFDCHRVIPDIKHPETSVCYYVTKYMLKADKRISRIIKGILYESSFENQETQIAARETCKLIAPRCYTSHHLGLGFNGADYVAVSDYISSRLDADIESKGYPCYHFRADGKVMPLTPYFRQRFVRDFHIMCQYYADNEAKDLDKIIYHDDVEENEYIKRKNLFDRQKEVVFRKTLEASWLNPDTLPYDLSPFILDKSYDTDEIEANLQATLDLAYKDDFNHVVDEFNSVKPRVSRLPDSAVLGMPDFCGSLFDNDADYALTHYDYE